MQKLNIIERDGEYVITGIVNGGLVLVRTGLPATADYMRFALEIKQHEEAKANRPDAGSLGELFARYSSRVPRPDANTLGYALRFAMNVGLGKRVSGIDTMVIEDFISRAHLHHSSDSAKRDYTSIMAMMEYGRRLGMPVPMIVRRPFPEYAKRKEFLPKSEWRDFARDVVATKSHIGTAVLLMLFAGARPGEAIEVSREDLILDDNVKSASLGCCVYLKTRKGGDSITKRLVPLSRVAAHYLEKTILNTNSRILSSKSEFLTLDAKGKPLKRSGSTWTGGYPIWDEWKELLRLALSPGHRNLRPSDLRRSYATALVREGIDVGIVSRLLGHSNLRQTSTYVADALSLQDFRQVRDALAL